jgi:site-specific recombinase XerD
MNLDILPQHISSYSLWLSNHQYQSNTIRNYLQDLRTFLVFSNNQISEELITKYFEQVTLKNNSGRYLASLSIFCQFLVNQHLTNINLYKHVKKHLTRQPSFDLEKLLIQYKTSLTKEHKSEITIKNYINDIHQYFIWLESNEIRN